MNFPPLFSFLFSSLSTYSGPRVFSSYKIVKENGEGRLFFFSPLSPLRIFLFFFKKEEKFWGMPPFFFSLFPNENRFFSSKRRDIRGFFPSLLPFFPPSLCPPCPLPPFIKLIKAEVTWPPPSPLLPLFLKWCFSTSSSSFYLKDKMRKSCFLPLFFFLLSFSALSSKENSSR